MNWSLVREYHTRIELRQIGVRHETARCSACGELRHGVLLPPVPAQVCASDHQNGEGTNLFLNPSKISGICGRLLCCLGHEQENFDIFHSSCSGSGSRPNKGPMKVLRANMFRDGVAL